MFTKEETPTLLRDVNFDSIFTFYIVSNFTAITKAASFLNRSQSAISRCIINLEKQLKCRLFIRDSRGINLTREGESLKKITGEYFVNMQNFLHAQNTMDKGINRLLRIGIHKGLSFLILKFLKTYQKSHPYLTFEISDDSTLRDISFLDLDIAFRPYHPNADNFEQLPFISINKNFLSSSNIFISNDEDEEIPVFFTIPIQLSEDEEIKNLYNELLSEITSVTHHVKLF